MPRTPGCLVARFGAGVVDFTRKELGRLPLVAPHRVVFLAAVAAEVRRVKQDTLVLPARRKPLGVQRDQALADRFERAEDLAGAADELMQLEGEQGPPVGSLHVLRCLEESHEPIAGGINPSPRVCRQPLGGRTQGDRAGTLRAPSLGHVEAQVQFHPYRQGVGGEILGCPPRVMALRQPLGKARPDGGQAQGWIRDALERFPDHVFPGDGLAEQRAGHARHDRLPVVGAARAGHRRRRADADHVACLEPLPKPADQERHVRPLPAPVRVKLVENKEREPLAMRDHPPIHLLVAGQDQLEHHEVRQEDVRRVLRDGDAFMGLLLPGVTRDTDGAATLPEAVEELAHLLKLAVGQGVHRVNDDGARPGPGVDVLLPQDSIEDRDEEGQGLAGTGAGGDDIALAVPRLHEGFLLVLEELQRRPVAVAKDVRATGVKQALGNQLLHRLCPLVVRVDLDQRLRPVTLPGVLGIHGVPDVLHPDPGEATRERGVLVHQLPSEFKDVGHGMATSWLLSPAPQQAGHMQSPHPVRWASGWPGFVAMQGRHRVVD